MKTGRIILACALIWEKSGWQLSCITYGTIQNGAYNVNAAPVEIKWMYNTIVP